MNVCFTSYEFVEVTGKKFENFPRDLYFSVARLLRQTLFKSQAIWIRKYRLCPMAKSTLYGHRIVVFCRTVYESQNIRLTDWWDLISTTSKLIE